MAGLARSPSQLAALGLGLGTTTQARAHWPIHTIPRISPAYDYTTGGEFMAPPVPYGHYAKDYVGAAHKQAAMVKGHLLGKFAGHGLGITATEMAMAVRWSWLRIGPWRLRPSWRLGLRRARLLWRNQLRNSGSPDARRWIGGLRLRRGGLCNDHEWRVSAGRARSHPDRWPAGRPAARSAASTRILAIRRPFGFRLCGDPGCGIGYAHGHGNGNGDGNGGCGFCGGKGCKHCLGKGGHGSMIHGKLASLVAGLHQPKMKWFVGAGGPVPLTPGYVPYIVSTRSPRDFFAFAPMNPNDP